MKILEEKKPEVLWLNRKKAAFFFSIEKVFSTLKPYFTDFKIREKEAVSRAVDIQSILANIRLFRKEKADIYHITGDIHYVSLGIPGKKTVLTIHDSVFLNNPVFLKRVILKLFWLTLPVKRVRFITAISEQSKREILANTSCDPAKIVVIHNPADPSFEFRPKPWPQNAPPVFLQVGTKPNKNLERVAEALEGIRCRLLIIGKLSDQQLDTLKKRNIDFTNYQLLSHEELINCYYECDALIFASLYEGFGLPVIEAQSTGRVVIASDIEPIKSVAAKAAAFVDPGSVQSIRNGILKVIGDENYRNELVKAGLKNVFRFRPEQIAAAYSKLYNEVAAINRVSLRK